LASARRALSRLNFGLRVTSTTTLTVHNPLPGDDTGVPEPDILHFRLNPPQKLPGQTVVKASGHLLHPGLLLDM